MKKKQKSSKRLKQKTVSEKIKVEDKSGRTLLKILGINLFLVIIAPIITSIIYELPKNALQNGNSTNNMLFIALICIPILICLANLVLGIIFAVRKEKTKSIAFFISAIIIPLIGFSLLRRVACAYLGW